MICMRVTLTVSCCTQGCAGSEEKNNSQNADSERAKVVDDKGAAVNDSSNTYISATVGLKEGTSKADMKEFFAKEVDGCPPLPLLPFVSILLCLLHPTPASTSQCPALLCPALLIACLNRWNSFCCLSRRLVRLQHHRWELDLLQAVRDFLQIGIACVQVASAAGIAREEWSGAGGGAPVG